MWELKDHKENRLCKIELVHVKKQQSEAPCEITYAAAIRIFHLTGL
jgi:hypothetical protein